MKPHSCSTLALSAALTLFSGCANPHFFPYTRPLFVGLDETNVPAKARDALAQAKVDFQLARKEQPPHYARFVRKIGSWTKEYQGRGYVLTLVDEGADGRDGPQIMLEPAITGGEPFQYDEIEEPL